MLTSDEPRFGGFSGLWLADDGQQAIAASDRFMGIWSLRLGHDAEGRLTGAADLHAVFAEGPEWKWNAEALAPVGRDALAIAHEGRHRIERRARAAPAEDPDLMWPLPDALADEDNHGIEALATLPDGRLLALAETLRSPAGDLAGWILDQDDVEEIGYAPSGSFAPTGAAVAGDWLFVVERSFELLLGGFSARVVMLPVGDIEPGARLVGREVLRLPSSLADNFEALAAEPAPGGRTRLYLLTDDNFLALQRTLLLQFSLRPAAQGSGP